MIIFAGCTAKDGIEAINTPRLLERGGDLIGDALRERGVPQDSIDQVVHRLDSLTGRSKKDSIFTDDEIESMDKNAIEKYVIRNIGDVFNLSEHTKKWMVRFGYIGIVVALIYAAGGLFMLIMKPFSIHLAYAALIISIVYALARAITLANDAGDLITLSSYVESGISVVIDIVLILVIFSSDKYEYEQVTA